MTDQQLLTEAKKHISDPNYIVDLYDMSLAWVSPNPEYDAGYSVSDLINQDGSQFMDSTSKDQLHQENMARALKDHGFDKITIKTKSGQKVTLDVEYKTFSFNNTMYSVGKVIPPKNQP